MNANLAFQVCGIGETAYLYYYMAQFPVGDLSLFKKKKVLDLLPRWAELRAGCSC